MIDPTSDRRHEPDMNDPIWGESWYFNALDPGNDLAVFMRIGLQPAMQAASVSVLAALDGREVFSRLYYNQPLPAGDVETGIEMGGFRFQALGLAEKYHLTFDAPQEEIAFDLIWNASMPLVDSVPRPVAELSSMHCEQFGTITGTFRLRDRALAVHGWSNRDHATGPRKWGRFSHHELAWPMFEGGTNLGFLRVFMRNGDVGNLSWVWSGGEFCRMTTERFDVVLGEEGKASSVSVAGRDERGRLWEVKGRRRSVVHWPWGGYLLNEAFFEYTLADGRLGYGLLELGYLLGSDGPQPVPTGSATRLD